MKLICVSDEHVNIRTRTCKNTSVFWPDMLAQLGTFWWKHGMRFLFFAAMQTFFSRETVNPAGAAQKRFVFWQLKSWPAVKHLLPPVTDFNLLSLVEIACTKMSLSLQSLCDVNKTCSHNAFLPFYSCSTVSIITFLTGSSWLYSWFLRAGDALRTPSLSVCWKCLRAMCICEVDLC